MDCLPGTDPKAVGLSTAKEWFGLPEGADKSSSGPSHIVTEKGSSIILALAIAEGRKSCLASWVCLQMLLKEGQCHRNWHYLMKDMLSVLLRNVLGRVGASWEPNLGQVGGFLSPLCSSYKGTGCHRLHSDDLEMWLWLPICEKYSVLENHTCLCGFWLHTGTGPWTSHWVSLRMAGLGPESIPVESLHFAGPIGKQGKFPKLTHS